MRVRASGLDPAWSSEEARGEVLLAGPAGQRGLIELQGRDLPRREWVLARPVTPRAAHQVDHGARRRLAVPREPRRGRVRRRVVQPHGEPAVGVAEHRAHRGPLDGERVARGRPAAVPGGRRGLERHEEFVGGVVQAGGLANLLGGGGARSRT